MLNYLINEETLTDIANAIRAENNIINLIKTDEMSALINSDENNKVVVINPTTNQEYSNIQIALNKALEGETIVIQEDISISAIIIPINVTLDLNGHNINTTYMACYGNIIDSSVENNGILYVPKENFLIQKNNTQLPIKNGDGYSFFEVIKFNEAYVENSKEYAFQPFIESSAHELLKQGTAISEVSICVYIQHTPKDDEDKNQESYFEYQDNMLTIFLNSYNSSTNKYSKMYTIKPSGNNITGKYYSLIKSKTGVEILSNGISVNG